MTRFRLVPVLALAAVSIAPTPGQSQVDDLRRRVEVIEQRMFQQQLAQPTTQAAGVQALEMRLRQLEMEIASERISQTAAAVTSRRDEPVGRKSIDARLDELEAQRAKDAATMAALTKRLEALEKPPVRRRR